MIEIKINAEIYTTIEDIVSKKLANQKIIVICKDFGECVYELQQAKIKIKRMNGVKCNISGQLIDGPFGMIQFADWIDANQIMKGTIKLHVFFTTRGLNASPVELLDRVNNSSLNMMEHKNERI